MTESIIQFLGEWKQFFVFAHAFGAAVGVGAVTVTDTLFFKFLRDYKISKTESTVLKSLSGVIWTALVVMIITGIGLYLPGAERLGDSPKFLAKMIVILVIFINGVLLNLYITPKLVSLNFKTDPTSPARKISFASGAVSIISWYTAFLLGSVRGLTFSFTEILLMYVGVLLISVIGSQVMERRFSRKAVR